MEYVFLITECSLWFFWNIHIMRSPHLSLWRFVMLSDMQARHMHKILTVTLKSTLNKLKYGRSFFFKETFHLGWIDFQVFNMWIVEYISRAFGNYGFSPGMVRSIWNDKHRLISIMALSFWGIAALLCPRCSLFSGSKALTVMAMHRHCMHSLSNIK